MSASEALSGPQTSEGTATPYLGGSRATRAQSTPSEDEIPYSWVLTRRKWKELLALLELPRWVVIDLETTGLDAYVSTATDGYPTGIVLTAITIHEGTYVIPMSHPDSPFIGQWRTMVRDLSLALAKPGHRLVNHNLRFDLLWLYRFSGIDLLPRYHWDTQVAAYLQDENLSSKLKEVVPRLRGISSWADVELSGGAHRVEWQALGHYAARDTHWTHWLWRRQRRELMRSLGEADDWRAEAIGPEERDDARLALLYHAVALPVEKGLHIAERHGVLLDEGVRRKMVKDRVTGVEESWDRVVAEDPSLFESWDGDISMAPTSHFFRSLTERAVERGSLRIEAMTPKGKPKWDRAVLTRQARGGSALAQAVLDWRGASKQNEYLEAWPRFVGSDGRVHPSFRSTSTVTGRTSCADPNLQQVTKVIKPAWVASPGFKFVEVDYSQIELRIAAWVAGCKPMLEAYERGDDLHTLMAAMAQGISPEEVTSDERQRGKAGNFGFLYGMGAPGFVTYAANFYGVAFTLEEADAFRNAYFETWEGLLEWHARVGVEATRTGQVISPLGRVRRVPKALGGDDYTAADAIRQAINSPVQSAASDLLQTGAALVSGAIGVGVEGVRVLGSVHDSILAEVREDGWQGRVYEVMRRMVHGVPAYIFKTMGVEIPVPLAVEAEVGSCWGDPEAVVVEFSTEASHAAYSPIN